MNDCVVYWLYDTQCVDVAQHGYIGVSTNWIARLSTHKQTMSREFKYKIIFSGTVDQCLELENKLRPQPRIGWNIAIGGNSGFLRRIPRPPPPLLTLEEELRRINEASERRQDQLRHADELNKQKRNERKQQTVAKWAMHREAWLAKKAERKTAKEIERKAAKIITASLTVEQAAAKLMLILRRGKLRVIQGGKSF